MRLMQTTYGMARAVEITKTCIGNVCNGSKADTRRLEQLSQVLAIALPKSGSWRRRDVDLASASRSGSPAIRKVDRLAVRRPFWVCRTPLGVRDQPDIGAFRIHDEDLVRGVA